MFSDSIVSLNVGIVEEFPSLVILLLKQIDGRPDIFSISKYTREEKFLEIGKLSTDSEFLCIFEKLQNTIKHRILKKYAKIKNIIIYIIYYKKFKISRKTIPNI